MKALFNGIGRECMGVLDAWPICALRGKRKACYGFWPSSWLRTSGPPQRVELVVAVRQVRTFKIAKFRKKCERLNLGKKTKDSFDKIIQTGIISDRINVHTTPGAS